MKDASLAVIAAWCVLYFAAGCRDEPTVVLVPPPQQQTSVADTNAAWNSLVPSPVENPRTKPKFIPAADARRAPELNLTTREGQAVRVTPGNKGEVTLVVFWSLDADVGAVAARYVRDLSAKYRATGVKALGIVEKTPTGYYRKAEAFLAAEKISFPNYYDDFSAMRDMARAAGERLDVEHPCFFIVDRELRVRLFKLGFSYTGLILPTTPTGDELLIENAAAGQEMETFLKQTLQEGGAPR